MFIERARNVLPLEFSDDYRCPSAHPNGGFPLND